MTELKDTVDKMKKEKKKTSPLVTIAAAIFIFYVVFFFYGIASAYISAQPTNKFDEKVISTCEREFYLLFDGSFTPVQFAHDGMRDSIYTLWIKDIGDPAEFMEERYKNMYDISYENGFAPAVPDSLKDYVCDISCTLYLKEKINNRVDISFYKNSAGNYAARFERAYY